MKQKKLTTKTVRLINQDKSGLMKIVIHLKGIYRTCMGSLPAKYPSDPFLRQTFFTKRNEYKRLIKKLKRQFHSSVLDKIKLKTYQVVILKNFGI